jgi:redox-sensing transcriptional repressor
MKIVAVFDASPAKQGETINNLSVQPMAELGETIRRLGVRIGIITVPASEAQNVANNFVAAGVEAVLNFAPVVIKVPNEVRVHHADFTAELQSLAYYLD